MTFAVSWDLYMDVTSPEKAKRFVDKLSALSEIPFELSGLERYNKGKITYKATLSSHAQGNSLADAMWETVRKGNTIARTWAITATDLDESDFSEVIGTAMPATIKVQGVESMEFRIAVGTTSSEAGMPKALAM